MQVSAPTKVNTEISEDFGEKLKLNVSGEEEEQKQEDEVNEEEFSFACTNLDGSPISADDIFYNGQIRPIFPIFDQSLLYDGDGDGDDDTKDDAKQSLRPPLKKLFIEERPKLEEEEPMGPFCEWSSGNKTVKEASSEPCKKSNSTGFSKLWRFRELVHRSNSDGRDAFVFLNNNCNNSNTCKSKKHEKSSEQPQKSSTSTKTTTQQKVVKVKRENNSNNNKKAKAETVSSMYEKHYVRNKEMREGDKRKSYSPYRQDLVGFFTNVHGLSRNVHPF